MSRLYLPLLAVAWLTAAGPVSAGPPLGPKPAASPYEKLILSAHPVGYWRLGEPAGAAQAVDASGHRHDGVYRGKPHFGQPGALALDKNVAIAFDGPKTKSYVEIAAHKAFSVATSGKGLSVEVWLRPDALVFAGEGDKKNPYIHWLGRGEAGAMEWGFRFYSGKAADRPNRISAYIWNAAGGEGSGAYFEDKLTEHKWIHIVATYDDPARPDARVRIYRNGVASPHNTSPGTLYKSYSVKPASGAAPLRFGTRDRKTFLTGGLDEVAIYPYVLTPDQIRQHWQTGVGRGK